MLKTELLAPAKDKLTAITAIDCGADAVYIGASNFGARKNASNSLNDIKEVVDYAHKFWVKVYVTVNTILSDNELPNAVELIKELNKINVDAIIIQDMGLLKQLIELKLPIPIHASTQCDNRENEKIAFFNKIGINRVVLARELSIEQIKKVHELNPDLELEVFIHGALCVSYSGQCYLSQYIGGRSANRGECAQPCRKKYTILDDNGNIIKKDTYALCLKDFNASKHLKELVDNGVFSFKIEGRLKDSGYVKNVVSYYRQELDKYSKKTSSGMCVYPFTPDVEKSFNRGFTDYFLKERTDCFNMLSPKSRGKYLGKVKQIIKNNILVDSDMNISAQDGLCYVNNNELEGFLVNKAEKIKDGILVTPNRSINIKKNTKIYRNLDVNFEKELLKPVKRQIEVNVKLDNNLLKIIDENNISITLPLIQNEPSKNPQKMKETFVKQISKTGESDFYIKNIEIEQEIPFIPISEINNIRRNAFDMLMKKRLQYYKRKEQRPLCYMPYYKTDLDYRANIHNTKAEEFYNKCESVAKERSLESKLPSKQIELMRTKHCIKYALNICKSPTKLFIQDEKGVKYPLSFDCKNCEMMVLSPNNS